MYDAFISYRHTPLDQFVAQNLHKKLEAFRLPSSLVKKRGRDCKKKIERVFRDRDGKTKREILKAMFGCAYDDLKQRYKEQKMKRLMAVSFAASSLFLAFGTVSAAMAFRI